jgi:hypothetical protein
MHGRTLTQSSWLGQASTKPTDYLQANDLVVSVVKGSGSDNTVKMALAHSRIGRYERVGAGSLPAQSRF